MCALKKRKRAKNWGVANTALVVKTGLPFCRAAAGCKGRAQNKIIGGGFTWSGKLGMGLTKGRALR